MSEKLLKQFVLPDDSYTLAEALVPQKLKDALDPPLPITFSPEKALGTTPLRHFTPTALAVDAGGQTRRIYPAHQPTPGGVLVFREDDFFDKALFGPGSLDPVPLAKVPNTLSNETPMGTAQIGISPISLADSDIAKPIAGRWTCAPTGKDPVTPGRADDDAKQIRRQYSLRSKAK